MDKVVAWKLKPREAQKFKRMKRQLSNAVNCCDETAFGSDIPRRGRIPTIRTYDPNIGEFVAFALTNLVC